MPTPTESVDGSFELEPSDTMLREFLNQLSNRSHVPQIVSPANDVAAHASAA